MELIELTRRHTKGEVSQRHHIASRARVLDRAFAPRHTTAMFLLIAAGTMTVGAAGFAATKSYSRRQAIGVQTPVPRVPPTSYTPYGPTFNIPSDPAEEAEATVTIEATPQNAKVYWDDKPLEGNPARMVDPPDRKEHRIRVEAPGYVSKTQILVLSGPKSIIALELRGNPFDIGPLTTSAPMPDADLVVEGLRDELRACYDEGIAEEPRMFGKATFLVHITEGGMASGWDLQQHDGLSDRVLACLGRVVAKAQFSGVRGNGDAVTLTIPISFPKK